MYIECGVSRLSLLCNRCECGLININVPVWTSRGSPLVLGKASSGRLKVLKSTVDLCLKLLGDGGAQRNKKPKCGVGCDALRGPVDDRDR